MKKITGQVKLQIPAGKANPAPPVGPALGQQGVNITVYQDRSFTFILKTPPASVLLKKAAGLHTEKKKGSGAHKPGKEKVGQVSRKQVEEIAKKKATDMTAGSLEAAMRTI